MYSWWEALRCAASTPPQSACHLSTNLKLVGVSVAQKSAEATHQELFFESRLLNINQTPLPPGSVPRVLLRGPVVQRGSRFDQGHTVSCRQSRDESPGLRIPPQHTPRLSHVSALHTLDAQNCLNLVPISERNSFTMAVYYHCRKCKPPGIPPASDNQC